MHKRLRLLASLSAALFITSLGAAPAAQAYHTRYQAMHVSSNSVSHMTFSNDLGTAFNIGIGGDTCCYKTPGFRVGSTHDVIVTSKEYPSWSRRYNAAGWYAVPALASPGHTTYRAVYNGG